VVYVGNVTRITRKGKVVPVLDETSHIVPRILDLGARRR
jgi:uncharacterized protein related to proFAR isomerase